MDIQAIKWIMLISFLSVLLFLFFILKRKGKYIVISMMCIGVVAFTFNELTVEKRIANQYIEYEKRVHTYLQEKYPDEEWDLEYNPEEKLGTSRGYELHVAFKNEPDAVYTYSVVDNQVVQIYASSTKGDTNADFQHFEQ